MPRTNTACRNHQAPYGYYWETDNIRGGGCSLKKRRNFHGVFGTTGVLVSTDPLTPAPTPHINCNRHQAPAGFRYRLVAGKCMLWRDNNTPVILPATIAGTGFIYQTPLASGGLASGYNTVSGFTNWIQNNKGLALGLAVGAYYLFGKK